MSDKTCPDCGGGLVVSGGNFHCKECHNMYSRYSLDLHSQLAAANTRIRKLEALSAAALKEWQNGIGEINNPWCKRMAWLLGDTEELAEAAKENDDGR